MVAKPPPRARSQRSPRALACSRASPLGAFHAGSAATACYGRPLRDFTRFSDMIGLFQMKMPVWTKPALWGAVAGAVAISAFGFTMGGWTTVAAAKKDSDTALVAAMTPYCVDRAAADPNTVALMAEFNAATATNRVTVVEKAGWATIPGATAPNREVARACQLALAKI